MAVVNAARFCEPPYPVTTTSSNVWVSSFRMMLIGVPSHFMVCVIYPTKEISITSPFFTFDREKFPSMSVIVQFVVPFTITEAPMTDSPVASFTIP